MTLQTTIHPDEVLESILSVGYRSNKVANLKLVHEICRKHHESSRGRLRDFSLPSIGRLCEAQGIFKGRVLYNKASKEYCDLILAWAAFSGPAATKDSKAKTISGHEYLMRIEDPAIRSIMQSVIAEKNDLKAQLNLLKSQTEFVINMRPLGATIASGDGLASVLLVNPIQLTDSEQEALVVAMSTDFLESQGWLEGRNGEVRDLKGKVIFDFGYTTALRKILASVTNVNSAV